MIDRLVKTLGESKSRGVRAPSPPESSYSFLNQSHDFLVGQRRPGRNTLAVNKQVVGDTPFRSTRRSDVSIVSKTTSWPNSAHAVCGSLERDVCPLAPAVAECRDGDLPWDRYGGLSLTDPLGRLGVVCERFPEEARIPSRSAFRYPCFLNHEAFIQIGSQSPQATLYARSRRRPRRPGEVPSPMRRL